MGGSMEQGVMTYGSTRRVLWIAALVVGSLWTAFGQYYFGHNKVQYTSFDWRVLQTDHFDIYYYPQMRGLAERGAAFAEDAYRVLREKFNHTISRRVPLVFYSSHLHFQQTNITPGFIPEGVGGFFEFVKGRVVIPSNGSTEQFRHVIWHELVHVFMHSKISRVFIDHRKRQGSMPPLWFTEGLAEYWSTTWNTQADMVLRDAILNDYLVPVKSMERIYGSFLMYKEGQSIIEFIARRYGEETILLLMENFWKSRFFSEVMKETIGKTYEEFDDEWIPFLRRKYYPLVGTHVYPSEYVNILVKGGFNAKPTYVTIDSVRYVYFIGNHTGYSNIFRVRLEREVGYDKPEPEVVIGGERSDELEVFHLFQSRIAATPSGLLAFVTKSGEKDRLHIYNVKREAMEESIQFDNLVMIGSVSWSPDGRRIAFSSIDESGDNDLYIYDIRSKELTRLTYDMYDDRDPAWSPDGSALAFSSDRTAFGQQGKYNLFLYHLTDARIEYVTYGPHSDHSPTWSPDGRMLAFTSDRDGGTNIWMMDLAADSLRSGRSIRKLTRFVTAAFDPEWASDDRLYFTVFDDYSFRVASLDYVSKQYDTLTVRQPVSLVEAGEVWTPPVWKQERSRKDVQYSGDYGLDFAQSQVVADPVFGSAAGGVLAVSDMLGNDVYYFLISNTARSKSDIVESFNIAISRMVLGKRTNYGYGIYRLTGNRYDLADPDVFYFEKAFGAYFALSHPLSRFRRLEARVSVTDSEKDVYTGTLPRQAVLVSNSISYVWDTSLWGPTGPLDGSRLRLLLGYTTDVQYSAVGYYSVIADYRKYLRIGFLSALAVRGTVWYNDGKEARRYIIGGSWDLRGWPRWSIRGQKVWIGSVELRFPLVNEIALFPEAIGIRLGGFRGALYADFGSAWDEQYRGTLGSVGAGVRLNFARVLVLRYDIGKRIENNMRQFQDGLYHQFFFGWDF
jgi:hypothetical protein